MAAQGDTIHVTWRDGQNAYKLPYSRSTNGGASFEPTRSLLTGTIFGSPPFQKIVANKNTVFLFFCSATNWTTPIYLMRSSDAGSTWSYPTPITTDSVTQLLYASILGDTVGIIHRENYNSLNWKLTLSTDNGDTWINPRSSVLTTGGEKVAIGSKNLHRLYTLGETYYRKSSDLGNTWSDSIQLSTEDVYASLESNLGVATYANSDRIFTAWRDGKYGGGFASSVLLRYSADEGNSWSDEYWVNETPDGNLGYGSVATENKTTAFVWSKSITPSNTRIQLRYSLDSGNRWSSICTPSDILPMQNQGSPVCAVSPSGFHVVWERRTETGGWGVFYRRGALITQVPDNEQTLPDGILLEQNYPNPFNPQTAIGFSLLAVSNVTLSVYDIFGKEVETLIHSRLMDEGRHTVEWNAEGFASGLYFYRLTAIDEKNKKSVLTKRMILMK